MKIRVLNPTLIEKLIFNYFKIFGLATMSVVTKSIDKEKNRKHLFFEHSKIGLVYNAILLIMVIVFGFWACRKTYSGFNYPGRSEFERVIDTVQITFSVITSGMIFVLFSLEQKRAIRLFIKIIEFTEESSTINRQILSNSYSTILQIFAYSFVVNLVRSFCATFATPMTFDYIKLYFTVFFTDFVINYVLIQYTLTLILILAVYKSINENLASLGKYSIDIKFIRQNDKSKLDKLKNIYFLNVSLYELSEDLANFYALPMIFSITHVFITLLTYAYYVVKSVIPGKTGLTFIQEILCLAQMVYYLVTLIFLTNSVTQVVAEAKKTASIINKWKVVLDNHMITSKLREYLEYLAHQNLQFTVFNLFSLDNSLLMSITGSITTYLVIVLQFHIT